MAKCFHINLLKKEHAVCVKQIDSWMSICLKHIKGILCGDVVLGTQLNTTESTKNEISFRKGCTVFAGERGGIKDDCADDVNIFFL